MAGRMIDGILRFRMPRRKRNLGLVFRVRPGHAHSHIRRIFRQSCIASGVHSVRQRVTHSSREALAIDCGVRKFVTTGAQYVGALHDP